MYIELLTYTEKYGVETFFRNCYKMLQVITKNRQVNLNNSTNTTTSITTTTTNNNYYYLFITITIIITTLQFLVKCTLWKMIFSKL